MTVTQIKKIRILIDDEIASCRKQVEDWEHLRNSTLFEIGNLLHDDVPVSNDEVNEDIKKVVGSIESRTQIL